MKTEKSLLTAFILNLFFAAFEFIGGAISGSIAISSDAVHDLGDCITLGIAYALEKKSHTGPDKKHTYGYSRYSTLGALITTTILIAGAIFIISEATETILSGGESEMEGGTMLIFAAVSLVFNLIAMFVTRHKHNANERAINIHILEDALGNLLILVGAVVINLTGLTILDPIMSIAVALLIIIMSIKNIRPVSIVFLEMTPDHLSVEKIRKELLGNSEIEDVHHLHFWNIDEEHIYVTLHVVTNNPIKAKHEVREILEHHKINHVTIETETPKEACEDHDHTVDAPSGHHHYH